VGDWCLPTARGNKSSKGFGLKRESFSRFDFKRSDKHSDGSQKGSVAPVETKAGPPVVRWVRNCRAINK
jgi:hypothetical protein